MRITYRSEDTHAYWERRWSGIPVDTPAENRHVYPLCHAELAVGDDREGRILEAGCGNGRILRYFHELGYRITGMDYVAVSIEKLRAADPSLDVCVGDVRSLGFPDASFRRVLAFGLYHNLPPEECRRALAETFRVLEPGGKVCASYRADNLHSRLIDREADRRAGSGGGRRFHKMNLTRREVVELFREAGFEVESVHPVENMPLLYKFPALRHRSQRRFDESRGRRDGYRLSGLGRVVQGTLMRAAPDQFCNVFVVTARRPA